jgi:tRNA (guanine9-N1)-methyltransferase
MGIYAHFQARIAAERPQRRLEEKTRRKARSHYLAEGHAAGTLTPAELASFEDKRSRTAARERARQRIGHGEVQGDWKGGVVVDLGFDDLMTDKVSSLKYHRLCG